MVTSFTRRFLTGWLLTASLVGVNSAWASLDSLTLSIKNIDETSYAGGPVPLQLRLENTCPEPVVVDLGLDYEEYLAFHIQKPDGTTVEATVPSTLMTQGDEGVFSMGRETIEPGDVLVRRVLLNKWLALETPGRYLVEVALTRPPETASGTPLAVSPARTELEIAEDSAALAEQCQSLIGEVHNGTDDQQRAAAETLGWGRHPACIPALAKLLDTRFLGLAVSALESIGTPEAARLLLDALDRVECSSAIGITQALARLRGKLTEPQLLAEIDRVLATARERSTSCLQELGFTVPPQGLQP